MLAQGTAIPVVILAMLAVGMGVGAVNGLFVSIFKFPPFMVTLSVMQITRGLVLYFTQGKTIYGFKDESFAFIGQGYLAKIPTAIWIFAVVGILAWVFLKKFTYGRKVLAVGSNATGAWYAGTNVKRVLFSVYVVSGFTAAVSGIISISRLMSTNSTLGDGLELDAIAAVVIGGTSLSGGSGFVLGTIVGALIIEVISNWLNLQGVDPFIREVIKGIIILLALLIDSARKGELANIRKSNNF